MNGTEKQVAYARRLLKIAFRGHAEENEIRSFAENCHASKIIQHLKERHGKSSLLQDFKIHKETEVKIKAWKEEAKPARLGIIAELERKGELLKLHAEQKENGDIVLTVEPGKSSPRTLRADFWGSAIGGIVEEYAAAFEKGYFRADPGFVQWITYLASLKEPVKYDTRRNDDDVLERMEVIKMRLRW